MVKKAKKASLKNGSSDGGKQVDTKSKLGFLGRAFTFLKEMKSELKKVVWPTKKKLFGGMFQVLAMVFIIAVIVVLSDLTFRHLLNILIRSV